MQHPIGQSRSSQGAGFPRSGPKLLLIFAPKVAKRPVQRRRDGQLRRRLGRPSRTGAHFRVKVPFLLLTTFAISVPSFFVLNTLLGVRADFPAVLRILLAGQAGLTIILAALEPTPCSGTPRRPTTRWPCFSTR
jgi:hypothetical protein